MKRRTHWLRNVLWLTAWAVVLVAVWQWRWLRDEYVLRTYQPRPDVVQLLDGVELTSAGLAALYRSDPIIDDKLSFAQHCPTESAGLELGCYDGGQIFILRIDNNQLAPEMKAVLVHEMLHAVWADLPANRRQELTERVQYYYQQEATQDIDLVERMAGYTETEPGEESNELHSILGSEQTELPVSLEEHYSLYIGNRQAIVGYHEQYSAVFEKQLSELEKELAAISSDKVTLEALNNRIDVYKRQVSIRMLSGTSSPSGSMTLILKRPP